VILVDTNVLVAAARTADTHHVAAARLLRETNDRVPGRTDGTGRDLPSAASIR